VVSETIPFNMAPAAAEAKKEKEIKKEETKTKDEPKKEEEIELVRLKSYPCI
jgi:hypothetical protein